jgi:hypothetical protein
MRVWLWMVETVTAQYVPCGMRGQKKWIKKSHKWSLTWRRTLWSRAARCWRKVKEHIWSNVTKEIEYTRRRLRRLDEHTSLLVAEEPLLVLRRLGLGEERPTPDEVPAWSPRAPIARCSAGAILVAMDRKSAVPAAAAMPIESNLLSFALVCVSYYIYSLYPLLIYLWTTTGTGAMDSESDRSFVSAPYSEYSDPGRGRGRGRDNLRTTGTWARKERRAPFSGACRNK